MSESSEAPSPPTARSPAAMQTTRTEPFSTETTDPDGVDREFGVGTVIGRYRVRRVVGAGGAGVVLAAYDDELARQVAIKFLVREHDEARTRLVREAQAMAQLSHPNVVTVYEVLRLRDRTGIVMALIDGADLGQWRAAAGRTWREIVGVYVQAARGLAAAHRAGLVHRDFKPSNALIDADGVVRVSDFGLVRTAADEGPAAIAAVAAGGPVAADLTRTGALVGTPAYMAPEQHTGDPADARTDQWALACSLYGALFQQRPFAGDTYVEIRTAVLAGELRAEPADTKVPKRVRAAIRRALSRRPEGRFATMDALITALTPRRREGIAVAVGGLAIAAVAIAIAVGRGSGGATCDGLDAPMTAAWNPTRAAALRATFAATGFGYATAAADRVVAGLGHYSETWIAGRRRACRAGRQGAASASLLDRRMECLDRRLVEVDAVAGALVEADRDTIAQADSAVEQLHPVGDCDDPRDTVPRPADPAVRAELIRGEDAVSRAWALGEVGKFEKAEPLSRQAVDIAEHAKWPPLIARAQLQLGRSLSHAHDGTGAVAAFDRAASAAAEAHDDMLVAESLIAKAYDLADTLGRPDDAIAMTPYVELALERAGQPPRVKANWLHHLAVAHLNKHEWDDAMKAETASAELLAKVVAPGNISLLDSLSTQAIIETWRGNLDRAEALTQQVLAADLEVRGPAHPTVSADNNGLGVIEIRRNALPAAIAYFEKADAIATAAGLVKWTTPTNIGLTRLDAGQWPGAVEPLERAVASAEQTAPGNSFPVAFSHLVLGAILVELGQLDRAKPALDRALAAATASSPGMLREVDGHLALYWLARGDLAAARTAVTAGRAAKGDPSTAIDLADAELARIAGDWKAARAAYDRGLEIATSEPSQAEITAATFGIGECEVAMGEPAAAVKRLDERLAWMESQQAEAGAMARGKLVLAQALIASHGDRTRAHALADAARTGFATLGAPGIARATAAGAWIAKAFGK